MFPSNPYEQPKDATLELLHDKMNVVAFAAIFAFASSSLNGGWPGHHATASFSLAYLVVDLGLAIFVPAMSRRAAGRLTRSKLLARRPHSGGHWPGKKLNNVGEDLGKTLGRPRKTSYL